ncbi:MAG: right-handed parallel beta-helix repeat-containing protein [Candidatus Eisenbacteria sp.]|nr:right-handed parallel beta-helix repeat-containing protein [Candidatus Eisenbacteria bacterium]
MRLILSVSFAICAVLPTGEVNGDTCRVPTDYPTIQEAIDAAQSGDTVLVEPGTYYDCTHPDTEGRLNCVIMKSGVTLRGETGDPDDAIVDATGVGRVIMCWAVDHTATIEALTITGGDASEQPDIYLYGGGICCRSSALTIHNCKILGNWAVQGGGILCASYDEEDIPQITDCTISWNTAESGGGLHCYGDYGPTISGCTITKNEAEFGGGIYTWTCDPDVIGCTISKNQVYGASSTSDGGGLYCTQGSAPYIEGCTISENSAEGAGGGICCDESSYPTIIGCTITINTADDYGGGMWCMSSSCPEITECTISANQAQYAGGGIGCGYSSDPVITRCVLARNIAEYGSGGGLYCYQGCLITIGGCTFSDNSAQDNGGGISCYDGAATVDSTIIAFSTDGEAVYCNVPESVILTCCDVYENKDGDWTGCIAGQEMDPRNFSDNPLFCDRPNDDYTIAVESPCTRDNSPDGCGLIGALDVACSIASVPETEAAIPGTFFLGPAIPNPFNPVTEISYGIPAGEDRARAVVNVYDVRGRQIRTLVDASHSPGIYRVIWDGSDRDGVPVASGVYFYRITWNGKSETTRMVLLK